MSLPGSFIHLCFKCAGLKSCSWKRNLTLVWFLLPVVFWNPIAVPWNLWGSDLLPSTKSHAFWYPAGDLLCLVKRNRNWLSKMLDSSKYPAAYCLREARVPWGSWTTGQFTSELVAWDNRDHRNWQEKLLCLILSAFSHLEEKGEGEMTIFWNHLFPPLLPEQSGNCCLLSTAM